MKKLLISLGLLAALVWGVWLLAVPASLIEQIAAQMAQGPLRADFVNLRKGLFYSIKADALDVSRDGARLLSVENVRVWLDVPASLRSLGGVLRLGGTMGGGNLNGSVRAGRKTAAADLALREASLERTGLYELTGFTAAGTLEADASLTPRGGKITFSATELRLPTYQYRGNLVPLNLFEKLTGSIDIEGDTVHLRSLALEGEGVYARATGTIRGQRLVGELVLMPEEETVPPALMDALIGQYRETKGTYRIPLNETLAF